MALNKARTSVWMKTFIIILIIAFISLFMYQGIVGIFDLFKSTPDQTATTTTSTSSVAAINERNQSTVNALKQLAVSQPASLTPAVNLANAYFDWAQELSTPQTGQSQITTGAMAAAVEVWTQARAAYDQATKLEKTFDPSVQTDRSAATFYSGDATSAIVIVRQVTVKQPKFPQAWLNLGLFYDSTNNSALAISSYQQYLALEPKGASASYATNRIKTLQGGTTTSITP